VHCTTPFSGSGAKPQQNYTDCCYARKGGGRKSSRCAVPGGSPCWCLISFRSGSWCSPPALARQSGYRGRAPAGRGAGHRTASERLILQARRRRVSPHEPLDRIADAREKCRGRPVRGLRPHAEHEGDRDQSQRREGSPMSHRMLQVPQARCRLRMLQALRPRATLTGHCRRVYALDAAGDAAKCPSSPVPL
jgi:hypothetical protein